MQQQKGQILIIVNILTSVLLVYSLALVNVAITARNVEKTEDLKLISKNIAEAGIEKAIWCFNQTSGTNCGGTYGSSYSGETNVSFGEGIYDITITSIDLSNKEIIATGYFPNKTDILSKSIIKTRVSTDTDKVSFSYGAQSGQGGIEMRQNAVINGSAYSNGNVYGANGARIAGDVYVAGGTALTADQEYTEYNNDFTFGQSKPIVDIAQSFVAGSSDVLNKVSVYIKKSNTPSNITVRIANDNSGTPGSATLASATLNSSLVSTNYSWIDVSFSSPPSLTSGTTYWLVLDGSKHNSRYWIIGSDAFDEYESGTMLYSEDWDSKPWTSTGYDINFKTWMGGVVTEINDMDVDNNLYANTADNVTVSGNAHVYTLTNSTISGNALSNSIDGSTINGHATSTSVTDSTVDLDLWCQNHSNVTVGGTNHCPTSVSPPDDPGPIELPISEAIISDWKTDAENGGIIIGNYTIAEDASLGPQKITGNLIIDNGVTLTITGTIYVEGSITLRNNAIITLDSGFGTNSGVIMSDGATYINNNVVFSGAGTGSYVLLLSTYSHATNPAIDVDNNATSAILYAPEGIIDITNNATIKQVNAGTLRLSNNVLLDYETGLADVDFSSGPSGGWSEIKGYWQIVE